MNYAQLALFVVYLGALWAGVFLLGGVCVGGRVLNYVFLLSSRVRQRLGSFFAPVHFDHSFVPAEVK